VHETSLDTFDVPYEIRFAPAIDIDNEHVKTFAVCGLWDALCDFGVGQFESDRVIKWYWKTAPTWAPQKSQAEFNRYARERVSDFVGYSRRRADAWGVIDRLFDDARQGQVSLEQVVGAIEFLCPTAEFPFPFIVNAETTLIDLTKRADSPKILKVDTSFLPLLKRLYPWSREDDSLIKKIPIGSTERELNLVTLVFWMLYPDSEKDERDTAVSFHNGDRLDWRSSNVFSCWREGLLAKRYSDRFYNTPTEKRLPNGDVVLNDSPFSKVKSLDGIDKLGDLWFAKPTATAGILNKVRQDSYERAKAKL
jgi:hypothetical protein